MRLYRIQGQSRHSRWQWAGTQDDAKRAAKECGGFFDLVEVPTDKPGLLGFLNQHCVGAVEQTERLEAPPLKAAVLLEPSYTHQSVALDDAWDALPLARKLHFAALAMEDARARL